MTKNLNKLITFILFIIVVGALLFRQKNLQNEVINSVNQKQLNEISISTPSAQLEFNAGVGEQKQAYEFVATMSSQNALELVQSQVKLDLKKYDFGTMIEGVNGLKADSKHYWALYQAGDYAKTGITELKLTKNEKIELKYEEIKL